MLVGNAASPLEEVLVAPPVFAASVAVPVPVIYTVVPPEVDPTTPVATAVSTAASALPVAEVTAEGISVAPGTAAVPVPIS